MIRDLPFCQREARVRATSSDNQHPRSFEPRIADRDERLSCDKSIRARQVSIRGVRFVTNFAKPTAGCATTVPALREARVDPIVVLRDE
jgi:hypothetical protein